MFYIEFDAFFIWGLSRERGLSKKGLCLETICFVVNLKHFSHGACLEKGACLKIGLV